MTLARASSHLSSSWYAASSLDAYEDGPTPSRNHLPIKTYEARSCIGLKLKIRQEARLRKLVQNTALDPVHQPSPTPQSAQPCSTHPRHHQPLPAR